MGLDKGLIDYYGLPHREYLYHLIQPFTHGTFLSIRPDQEGDLHHLAFLEDRYTDMGPFSGVLTAFDTDPECAWLVVACDFPLLDKDAILLLIDSRDPDRIATCFHEPESQMPEPLLAIWEPNAKTLLRNEFEHMQGRSSLNRILQASDAHMITPPHPEVLWNANTPEEVDAMRRRISQMRMG